MNYISLIFPGVRLASSAARDRSTGLFLHVAGVAESGNAWQQYSSETNYIVSSPSMGIYFISDMF